MQLVEFVVERKYSGKLRKTPELMAESPGHRACSGKKFSPVECAAAGSIALQDLSARKES